MLSLNYTQYMMSNRRHQWFVLLNYAILKNGYGYGITYIHLSGESSTMSHWRSSYFHSSLTFPTHFNSYPLCGVHLVKSLLWVGVGWDTGTWMGRIQLPFYIKFNHNDHILTFLHQNTFHLCPLRFSYQIFHTLHCQILLPFILHVSPKTEG